MNIPQITDALHRIFHKEGNRLVFWYDPSKEFDETIPHISINDVKVIRLDQVGALELKIKLELEDTAGKYLIYAPYAEPIDKDNWLLDVQIYSRSFHADRASILLDELGLTHYALRAHLQKHQAFFKSQDRINRIKKWIRPEDTESDLDMKMLAVLARAENPDIFNILMKLFGELYSKEEKGLLFETLKAWDEIEKYGLDASFWNVIAKTFGYIESEPKLFNLLICLLVTDFAQGLKGDPPQPLRHFLLTNKARALNASVFLSQWRGNVNNYESYNILSQKIESDMKIEEHISSFDEHAIIDIMTFESAERRIIRCLRDQLLNRDRLNITDFKEIIRRRRDGHWANPHMKIGTDKDGADYSTTYTALEAAADLFELRRAYEGGFSYPDARAMYVAYTEGLFLFDQLYRLFREAADMVELKGWDILKDIHSNVEACYSSWFIDQLAITWSELIDKTGTESLMQNWSFQGISNHHNFFKNYVEPILKSSAQSKIYVIVSDAFRYEAADELTKEINSKSRFKALLGNQLGVLPSYTSLGIAALLPHKSIDFKETEDADILVNGKPVSSLEQRSKLLSEVQGIAVKFEDLMAMNKDQGREFVKQWRVIYIFHNQIDAVGDAAVSETKTFDAVRTAIKEISSLVSFIINSLNGNNIFVTSDHGFLYQETAPVRADKSELDVRPAGLLRGKKRYILGTNLGTAKNVWHGNTKGTAGTTNSLDFWIPKGANRFHFVGGARYFHGGAMLQEIVVPIITIKELSGQAAERAAVRKVDVSLLGNVRKIVNNIQRFDFIQTEAVGERILPRTLVISLRYEDELISNEVTLTFDSQSSSMEDRKKSAKIIIKAGQYDKKKEYVLTLREAETKIEYMRVPLTIDLAFSRDF